MAVETNDRRESAQWENRERETGTEGRRIERDQLFHLLQNERRRRALDYLRKQEGSVRMRDVVDHVAAAEHDTSPEALRSDERKRVHIALYQSHLPKLDQAGVIDYDQDRGIISRTALAGQLDPYLEAGAAESTATAPAASATESTGTGHPGSDLTEGASTGDGWYRYYLALAGLSVLFLLGSVAVGSAAIPPAATAAAVVAAFGALAVAQWQLAEA